MDKVIYYKGLVGSRLFHSNREDSDYDYWIVTREENVPYYQAELPKRESIAGMQFGKYNDYFYYSPEKIMTLLFADIQPSSVSGAHNYLIEGLFSDPEEATPFGQWLIANREAIILANRPLFGHILLRLTKHALSIPYNFSPKMLVKAWTYLKLYIDYANGTCTFKETMDNLTRDNAFIKKVQMLQYSNLDILEELQKLFQEAHAYEDFWNSPVDTEQNQRLQHEMAELFQL